MVANSSTDPDTVVLSPTESEVPIFHTEVGYSSRVLD